MGTSTSRLEVPCGKRTDFEYDKDFYKKYTIGKLLGHGHFGYTYIATRKSNGHRVAVKKINKAKMVLPIAVEDVKREVNILKALRGHENVVQFYNAFEDRNYVYIVMELCQGGDLHNRILAKKDMRYPEKDAAVLVRQMLKVAVECHLHGLVHRDMKPENFVFKSPKEDSPLKAIDFGISDFIHPGKKFNNIAGTPYYIAPEVLKQSSGAESDVRRIGVIAYMLLCGRYPFWDITTDGIYNAVLHNEPDFRDKPWTTISNNAKDFVRNYGRACWLY